jgi:hypothetical protein
LDASPSPRGDAFLWAVRSFHLPYDVFYIIVTIQDIIYTSFYMEGPHDHVLSDEGGASVGNVRGVVESLTRVVEALNRAGVELIGEHARSDDGGRGVRLKEPGPPRRT